MPHIFHKARDILTKFMGGSSLPKNLFTYRNEYYVYKDTNSESNTITQGGAIQQLRHAKFAILDLHTPPIVTTTP